MMKYPDKQQAIILAVSAVLMGGFGVFSYVPILRQKHAIREQMDQQAQVIEEVCSKSVLLPEIKHRKNKIEQEMEPFFRKIPQGRNFAQLWQQVADVMNECSLKEQLVQPGSELKSSRLCSIPLMIECKGSLEQLYSFLQQIEDFDRLIRFEQIEFKNDDDFSGFVKMNARASVYYQLDRTDNG